jgi:hypothetical protein
MRIFFRQIYHGLIFAKDRVAVLLPIVSNLQVEWDKEETISGWEISPKKISQITKDNNLVYKDSVTGSRCS